MISGVAEGRGRLVRGPPVGDRGRPGTHAELGVDPPDVVLHRFLGQEQPGGDLAVRLPVGDERHHLRLPRRQRSRFPGAVGTRGLAWRRRLAACSGPVRHDVLIPDRPRILGSVHLSSGCQRYSPTAANLANTPVNPAFPMKANVNAYIPDMSVSS